MGTAVSGADDERGQRPPAMVVGSPASELAARRP